MKAVPHVVIEPKKKWQLVNFKEFIHYRDLFYFLVLRDIKILYKQTILGFAWAILNPFFNMVVFSVIFGAVANLPSDGIPYPIFSYAALVPWTYFSQAINASSLSLISNTNLLTKVYFPRIIIPLTPVVAKLMDFAISFILLIGLMFYYHIFPTYTIIYLPYLTVLMIITASGAGMWFSALAIQYRDVKFAMTFLMQLLMYAAPVVYPASKFLSALGPVWYKVYALYPMVGVVEGFRSALLGRPMPWDLIWIGSITALLIFISGAYYFRKMERTFADVA